MQLLNYFVPRNDKLPELLAPIETASFFAGRQFYFCRYFSGKKDRVKSGTGFERKRNLVAPKKFTRFSFSRKPDTPCKLREVP